MQNNYKYGICSGCGNERLIIHRSLNLCHYCNEKRKSANRKPIKRISKRGKNTIKNDELTYEKVWNSKPHFCEECGVFLGDDFRDYRGRVINKFRYSHIISKGAMPEARNDLRNFNLLCLKHHTKWETGDRKSMRIYKKNQVVIKQLRKEYNYAA